ncbi:hypothetical protein [Streptomyces chattanoogensis]|uniref:hypothetical protein n=1 Tax=Streptomyces chattanoogensis TaxID=66876 RepID=UPI00369D2BAB
MAIKTTEGKGPRFYFDTDNPAIKYPGVTAIVGMLPKPFLQRWNANMAADCVVENIDFVYPMIKGDPKGARQYIAGAAYRYTRDRQEIGNEAHDMFERMIRGERVGYVARDMEPFKRHFGEFLDAVQPELVRAEDVAWSDAHKYAGSFDAALRLRLDENGKPDPAGESALVIADWKTGKNTYPDVALQMSAYAHAEAIIAPDGSREPMPEFDGACVLHITADECEFLPVAIDEFVIDEETHNVFEYFLHLRQTFSWDRIASKKVLGDSIWSMDSGALVTGTQRRAR